MSVSWAPKAPGARCPNDCCRREHQQGRVLATCSQSSRRLQNPTAGMTGRHSRGGRRAS